MKKFTTILFVYILISCCDGNPDNKEVKINERDKIVLVSIDSLITVETLDWDNQNKPIEVVDSLGRPRLAETHLVEVSPLLKRYLTSYFKELKSDNVDLTGSPNISPIYRDAVVFYSGDNQTLKQIYWISVSTSEIYTLDKKYYPLTVEKLEPLLKVFLKFKLRSETKGGR